MQYNFPLFTINGKAGIILKLGNKVPAVIKSISSTAGLCGSVILAIHFFSKSSSIKGDKSWTSLTVSRLYKLASTCRVVRAYTN